MMTVILILHGLIAVALLGAVTHQALSVTSRKAAAPQSFLRKFRNVGAASYANAVVVLFIITCIGGALIYPPYRLEVRPTLEDLNLRAANGVFEMKEHFAAIGLGLLPAYWAFWKVQGAGERAVARKLLTWMLALIVWWNFLIGHILNNIRGIFQ